MAVHTGRIIQMLCLINATCDGEWPLGFKQNFKLNRVGGVGEALFKRTSSTSPFTNTGWDVQLMFSSHVQQMLNSICWKCSYSLLTQVRAHQRVWPLRESHSGASSATLCLIGLYNIDLTGFPLKSHPQLCTQKHTQARPGTAAAQTRGGSELDLLNQPAPCFCTGSVIR